MGWFSWVVPCLKAAVPFVKAVVVPFVKAAVVTAVRFVCSVVVAAVFSHAVGAVGNWLASWFKRKNQNNGEFDDHEYFYQNIQLLKESYVDLQVEHLTNQRTFGVSEEENRSARANLLARINELERTLRTRLTTPRDLYEDACRALEERERAAAAEAEAEAEAEAQAAAAAAAEAAQAQAQAKADADAEAAEAKADAKKARKKARKADATAKAKMEADAQADVDEEMRRVHPIIVRAIWPSCTSAFKRASISKVESEIASYLLRQLDVHTQEFQDLLALLRAMRNDFM